MKKQTNLISDKDFISKIKEQTKDFSTLQKVSGNKKQREAVARKIIETVPNRLKNYTVHKNIDEFNPTYIVLYSDFKQELRNPENSDFPYEGSKEYKRFKHGTVGYYLGRYLYMLGLKYSTWMGTLQIILPKGN